MTSTRYWPRTIPRTLTVPQTSLHHNLEVSAARYPDKVALWYYGQTLSYAELMEQTARLAGHLQRRGVGKGDRVLVWLQNSPAFAVACHAVWRSGAVVVALSPMLTAPELKFFLNDAGITVGMVGAELYPRAREAGLGHAVVTNVLAGVTDSPVALPAGLDVPEEAQGGDTSYAEALSGEPGAVVTVTADDLAFMPYTSGTTGRPKGCMHTHATIQANVFEGLVWLGAGSDEVLLGTLPFFHVTGFTDSLMTALAGGSTLVVMNRWDRETARTLIRTQGVTCWTNTATMLIDLLANPALTAADLVSLRNVTGGEAALPQAVGERFEALAGFRFVEGYGLTETMAQTHTNPSERPKLQCLGIPVCNTDARVIDPDTLREVAPNETGEIVVSGPQVMQGYWKRPDDDAAAFLTLDGRRFFRTGDLGYMDDEGYFFMVDRLKRMINAAGLKIWPAEVESALFAHPAVQQAVVIGVPDERSGERARALIVRRPGTTATGDEIAAWARDHLAAYKIPRDWQFVDSLPIGGTGKVNWRSLQEQARMAMTAAREG